MHTTKRALLAAGLLAGAAALTGCSAATTTVSTPTPQTQKVTAQPAQATSSPGADTAQGETSSGAAQDAQTEGEGPRQLHLLADGRETDRGAAEEDGMLLLPLAETAEALGWKAEEGGGQEDAQQKRVITLDRGESRITVSWTVSDNTAKNIVWQKDGLLIPVDTHITTIDGAAYVPSAFFETAMDAVVTREEDRVTVELPQPEDTPETQEPKPEGNG